MCTIISDVPQYLKIISKSAKSKRLNKVDVATCVHGKLD